jgi:hypothetical protein
MKMTMKIRSVVAISVALAGLSASTAVYAAPTSLQVHVHAMFAKSKIVKFNVRNDTGAALELKVGDNVMTIEAGKTVALKLAIGTRILTNVATPTHEAGSLLAEVSPQLDDATIGIK